MKGPKLKMNSIDQSIPMYEGYVIKGRHGEYTVGSRINGGGNGTVFDVEISHDDGTIPNCSNGYVINTLNTVNSRRSVEEIVERFIREVTVVVEELNSADLNVIPIYDSFLESEGDYYWYIMPKANDYVPKIKSAKDVLLDFIQLGETLQRIHEL